MLATGYRVSRVLRDADGEHDRDDQVNVVRDLENDHLPRRAAHRRTREPTRGGDRREQATDARQRPPRGSGRIYYATLAVVVFLSVSCTVFPVVSLCTTVLVSGKESHELCCLGECQ